ncbi:MAG: DUF883 domain-containing protein [Sinobacteraceae bacterium]|nr:DUF883 domain-containing protein [Nevskiaceae bacterium]
MLERTAAQSAALAEELRNVVRQAEKLITAIGEDREEALSELRERLSVAVEEARHRLADFEENARRLKDNMGAAADEFVHENPWTAVGIGAALGLILGSWIASGSRE